jgi:hypothetical protein
MGTLGGIAYLPYWCLSIRTYENPVAYKTSGTKKCFSAIDDRQEEFVVGKIEMPIDASAWR